MRVVLDTNILLDSIIPRDPVPEGHPMSVTVVGIVKNGVVVPSAPLPEGAHVEVTVVGTEGKKPPRLSMFDFVKSLPPGPRAFKTWEEYERHLRAEKDAWER